MNVATTRLFVQLLEEIDSKGTIKTPRSGHLWMESTGDWRIPSKKGVVMQQMFPLKTMYIKEALGPDLI